MTFSCTDCGRSFNTELGLRGHSSIHKNKPSHTHYKCCSLLTKEEVSVHQLDFHESRYLKNMKVCIGCSISFSSPTAKFCSQSCGARYNNKLKKPRTDESKRKTAESVSIFHATRPGRFASCQRCKTDFVIRRKTQRFCSRKCGSQRDAEATASETSNKLRGRPVREHQFTSVTFINCARCEKPFWVNTKRVRKMCSEQCRKDDASAKMSARLHDPVFRQNYGRGKRSYLERSFDRWLTTNGVVFETEFPIRRPNGRHYYVDFYFPHLSLMIELDGTQHRLTVESDAERDEYMNTLGYRVVRVTASEYSKKTKYSEICNLLGIVEAAEGIEP